MSFNNGGKKTGYGLPGQNICNIVDVQKFQEHFSLNEKVYLLGMGTDFILQANLDISDEESDFLGETITESVFCSLKEKLGGAFLEDIMEEPLEKEFCRLLGLTVKAEGKPIHYWILFAVIEEEIPAGTGLSDKIRKVSEEEFEHAVEFLAYLCTELVESRTEKVTAEDELVKEKDANRKIEAKLLRNNVMTKVVQKLESDDDIATVIYDILCEVGGYLKVDSANLMRINKEESTVDIICEWTPGGVPAYKEKNQNRDIQEFPFITGQPCIISSNTQLRGEFRAYFNKFRLKAAVSLPIEVNNAVIMYLNFWEINKSRIWEMDEIRFLHNIKKFIQEILSKRIVRNSLAGSFASLEAILENIGCGVYVKDVIHNEILFKNHLYRNCFEQYQKNWNMRGDGASQKKPVFEVYVEEEKLWFDLQYTEITWVDERKVTLCTAYDITEKKLYQQKIEKHANNDFLTGLCNRMRCEEDLKNYIDVTIQNGGEGAVLFIDLDDFKHINDGLGHQYGDVLLKAISNSLKNIPGIESTCYRMGGDEFVIIVTDTHYHKIDEILKDIMDVFSKPWYLKGAEYYCTMSMGVVRFPVDGAQVDELIRKADIALFEAKKSGKNRVEYYNGTVSAFAVKRLDMEKNMRNASIHPQEEFEVYYQPLIDISLPGNPCTGAEALIRWNSASLGFISPTEFIPLAEYLGLIHPIGLFVLEEACRNCKYWNDMGHPGYKVNVNLSVIQLLQNDMADNVKRVLEETRLDPQNLTLEVTESLAINDMNYMKLILNRIKKLGVRVALDDFGTGYSSLNHIREMPIDIIKVDKCFVNDLGKDEYSDVFVKMVTELANAIHVNVCVEGVEKEEQYHTLQRMNVNMIQGFYFDAPMPLRQFEEKYL